jgi:hypothetical protein
VSGKPAIYQLSYRIASAGDVALPLPELQEAIRKAGERVRDVVSTGWSMFYQFTRPEIAPQVHVDTGTGEEVEAIETDLREHGSTPGSRGQVWRITADGRATLIRQYREDTAGNPRLAERGLTPGTWLSPYTLIREVYELATHAKELAKFFPGAQRIEFCCTWQGLKGRALSEFGQDVDWHGSCHAEQRSSSLSVSLDELSADTASVVSRLAAPVLHLFGGLDLSREWIQRQVRSFRMI